MKKALCALAALMLLLPSFARAQGGYEPVFPRHEPYGAGIGAMPGRVTWAHDPACVTWDGTGYWWETDHFDEAAMLAMVNGSVAALAGAASASEGWDGLFRAHNAARGKSAAGYAPGEKIAIKANMNGAGVYDDSTDTRMSYTNPVLLRALLLSLVTEAGVAPADITVYDVSRVFPAAMMALCTASPLEGVRFEYRDALRTHDAQADTAAPVVWSQAFGGDTSYLPTCVTGAEYLVNLANLKGHSYGVTLCAKNHFGSLMNSSRLRPPEAANLHQFLTRDQMDVYTVLVDLMANAQLGGKTVLYMLDAILCAPTEGASVTGDNARWQQQPFDGYYTASVLISQDPVAIDSVGADFLMNEPAVIERNSSLRGNPTVESYLHEAALAVDAPSGTEYRNGLGQRVASLGVHEHWNDPISKQYSRNLGKAEGIELVRVNAE